MLTDHAFALPPEIKIPFWQAREIKNLLKADFTVQLLYTCQQRKRHLLQFNYPTETEQRYVESPKGQKVAPTKLSKIIEEIEMQPLNNSLYPTLDGVQNDNRQQ